ncbi:Transcriptional regulatory protein DegU [Enhygromyxa salina]|uniref:Transcriptional regulatory protein DegU n=1 Tax=Enhygromyxa salina TaxID=215803 RepID=A0A2S9XXL3_9BACT|nr:helix-turn-helix transcriptional regulator [Enhygromyxa salina]PRP97609.1 Transcriptional regulatory protein DegU [Enhygromyxa salina]
MTNTDITTTTTEVHIRVAHDQDASRISAVLEALGYSVLRQLDEGDGPQRLRWAMTRLARRHKLTARERDILELVLDGRSNVEIGRKLEISRATVKWHMHNVFAKTNTGNRESLLRLALQLGGGADTVDETPTASVVAPTPAASAPAPMPAASAPAVSAPAASAPAPMPAGPTREPQVTSVGGVGRTPKLSSRSELGHWASPEDVTARIDFDQPRVPSADSIPSKSWQ